MMFFFFQAEDGIRDKLVTGVQTCALPISFPLREKTKLKEAEIEGKVLEMLDQVGLTGMGHKFPAELSGGMRKRAGLARALVMVPEIILIDEPTTGLEPLMSRTINHMSVVHK